MAKVFIISVTYEESKDGALQEGLQEFDGLINSNIQPIRAEQARLIGVSDCKGHCSLQKNCQKEWEGITPAQSQHRQLLTPQRLHPLPTALHINAAYSRYF